jgi:hypothetical protein
MINRRYDRRTFIKKTAADHAVAAGRSRLEMRVVAVNKIAASDPARLREQESQLHAQETHSPQAR